MTTFNQQDQMAKLLQTLARCTLPHERDVAGDADNPAQDQADDLAAYYDFIEQARSILKQKPKRRSPDSSMPG